MNSVFKAIWTPSTLLVMRLANVNSQTDETKPLDVRLVTMEDEINGAFTRRSFLKTNDPVHEGIATAIKQI